MDVWTAAGMVVAGVFIGVLSGMFGFGGSSISTPVLRVFFAIPPLIALGSPLPMTLISSSVATWKYHREGLVDWRITFKLILTMIPGSILGAALTAVINGKILMYMTAAFLAYVAVRFIIEKRRKEREAREVEIYAAGFVIGLVSGLLANGGGTLVVPVLVLLGVGMKRAVGTSMSVVLLGVLPSVLVHWYLGHIDWLITLLLTIGVLPATYLGARMAIRMSSKRLKKYYGIFLLLFAIYFVIFELVTG